MKKLLVVSAIAALGLTSVAFAGGLPEEMPVPAAVASDSGVYIGISGGYGLTNWKNFGDKGSVITGVKSENGFIGRAFLGYDINRYFALEAGYTYFFNRAKLQTATADAYKIRTQIIDLFGKIKAPVVDNFDLYAKLGANYLMSSVKAEAGGITDFDKSRNTFNVAYGAGADYYITPNVIANVEWLRHNGCAKLNTVEDQKKYQPYTDSFLLGLRYRFDM